MFMRFRYIRFAIDVYVDDRKSYLAGDEVPVAELIPEGMPVTLSGQFVGNEQPGQFSSFISFNSKSVMRIEWPKIGLAVGIRTQYGVEKLRTSFEYFRPTAIGHQYPAFRLADLPEYWWLDYSGMELCNSVV